MKIRKEYSVNHLLSILNIIVFILVLSVLIIDVSIDTNPYINNVSLFLGLLLCVQIGFFLILERSRNDPFILVLAYITIVFYSFRIFTLALYPFSHVFGFAKYSPADSNMALIIIILSNLFLGAGFFSQKLRLIPIIYTGYIPQQPKKWFILFISVIFYEYILKSFFVQNQSRYESIIYFLIDKQYIYVLIFVYVIVYRLQIKPYYVKILWVVTFFMIVMRTLEGSRSGILLFVNILFFLVITILPFWRIKIRIIACISLLFPVVIFLMFYLYAYATTLRNIPFTERNKMSVIEKVESMIDVIQYSPENTLNERVISGIFGRVGYFDFTAEIIANEELYHDLFTPKTYFKSIVDNIFTPGFDVFDFPKIGNSLALIRRGEKSLTKSEVLANYQSDQISLIAELYSLFGYGCFIILFFLGRILKRMYIGKRNDRPFNLALKRVFLVIIFYTLLLSFGLDWLLVAILPFITIILIMKFCFPLSFKRLYPIKSRVKNG